VEARDALQYQIASPTEEEVLQEMHEFFKTGPKLSRADPPKPTARHHHMPEVWPPRAHTMYQRKEN
jgi:hypothetical protein